jgi:DNA-binding MarR family transcriptional regulator
MSNTRRMAREPAAAAEAPVSSAPATPTKIASVLALLRRREGASLAELVAATGWLPHTTRATLTGLKKKGHNLTKVKVDRVTRYRIAGVVNP